MNVVTVSLRYIFLAFLSIGVCACALVFAQSSDILDLDDFDSDDDFVGYLLGVLGEDSDEDFSDIDEDDGVNPGYDVTKRTEHSVTIVHTLGVDAGDEENVYTVDVYTDSFDNIDDASAYELESFVSRLSITPTYTSEGDATLYVDSLLPGNTYYMVVTPGDTRETNTGVELVVTTEDATRSHSNGYAFLESVLFDWDAFSSYIDEGDNSAYFLGLLLGTIEDMSVSRQTTVIRGMHKNLQAIKQSGFISLGLDYNGFIDLLDTASQKSGGASLVGGASNSVLTVHDDLEISWQEFPAKESGKKVIVFRTNFSALGVSRSTWHMDLSTIHSCGRAQCDRFSYLLDDNERHTIDINMITREGGEYVPHNETIKIDL